MIDFDAHLAAPLFSVYGRPVAYSPSSRLKIPAAPIVAIFDRAHEIVLDEMQGSELRQAGHSTTAPVLTVREADFVSLPEQNDSLTVLAHQGRPAAGPFVVWGVQPDGEGCLSLILREG